MNTEKRSKVIFLLKVIPLADTFLVRILLFNDYKNVAGGIFNGITGNFQPDGVDPGKGTGFEIKKT